MGDRGAWVPWGAPVVCSAWWPVCLGTSGRLWPRLDPKHRASGTTWGGQPGQGKANAGGFWFRSGGVAALLVWPFSVPENPGNIHRAPPLQPPPPRACGFRCAVALLGSQWLFPDPGPLSLWVETARAPIDSQGLVLHCPLCAVCSAGPCLGLWGGHLGTRPLLSPP